MRSTAAVQKYYLVKIE